MKSILKINFIILLILCSCKPTPAEHKKYMNNLGDYIIGDQSKRNEFHKKQAADDLTGCPVLVDLGRWEEEARGGKYKLRREFGWLYADGIKSLGDFGIFEKHPSNSKTIYVGPWKDIEIKYGNIFNRKKIKNQIRYIAFQGIGSNNQFYSGFEFKTQQNENITEQSIKLISGIAPDFTRLCEVKWIAKYGYNAALDRAANKIIEVTE